MIRILFFFLLSILPLTSLIANGDEEKQLKFVQNKNQWESHILYKADLPSGNVFLHQQKLTWLFYEPIEHGHGAGHGIDQSQAKIKSLPTPKKRKAHAYALNFLNSNPDAVVTGREAYNFHHNYFIGNDPAKWAGNVPIYNEVWYKALYDKIDLRFYEFNNSFKYEFIVAPKTNPDIIALDYEGLDAVYIKNGALHLKTSVTEIVEKKPVAFQFINNNRIEVPCEFVLRGSTVSFAFPQGYNRKYELIIDPELIFSTYSGSTADNWGSTACFDFQGNAYSAGTVYGVGFPSTVGTQFHSYTDDKLYVSDIGILKFNSTGNQLLYATYLGGLESDFPISMVTNSNNELVIMGVTSSYDFPGKNAANPTYTGGTTTSPSGIYFKNGTDLFVTVLNENGNSIIGSTYIGGNNNDGIMYDYQNLTKNYGDQFRGDVIVDSNDYIYVASHTLSTDFPSTTGVFQESHSGFGLDAVIFKLSPNVSNLEFSTFLGGSGYEGAYSIQLDKNKNIYITGGTTTFNFPGTSLGLNSTYKGGIDAYVTKINTDATAIISSTYLGTTAYDQAYFIQLDNEENVYVLGQTSGLYPVSSNVYSNIRSKIFIHKLSNDLSKSILSTVVGEPNAVDANISPTAFLVNDCGNIFIAGWGGGENTQKYIISNTIVYYKNEDTNGLITTSDAIKKTTDGADFYLMVLEKDAVSLLYATYLGGNGPQEHVDGGTSRFSKDGIVYQAVCANCRGYNTGFPTTPSAWSRTNLSSNCTNAVFKFDLSNLKARITADTTKGCIPKKIIFSNRSIGGKQFEWYVNGQLVSNWPLNYSHTFTAPGEYIVTLVATDLTTCLKKDTASLKVSIFDINPPIIPPDTICKGDSIQLLVGNYASFQWSPDENISNTSVSNPVVYPESSIVYSVFVTDTNNCSKTFEVPIEVASINPPLEVENITDCKSLPSYLFKLSTEGPLQYHWDFGDGEISTEKEPTHIYQEPGIYDVRFKIFNSVCSYEDSLKIPAELVFIPNLITPNHDGKNEVYHLKGKGDKWNLDIYNRWGKLVYTHDEYDNSWSGAGLSDGVYYFLITSPNGVSCKGWVEIIR